jgi:hypothetical protein
MNIFNSENLEDDILEKLVLPYLSIKNNSLNEKKELALDTYKLNGEILLLPAPTMFKYSAIISGISEKQIEYISNNAPSEYKKELLESILQSYKVKEIFEIAKAMDDDLGRGSMQNQDRVRNVIQYIKDNRIAFEF